MVVRKKLLFRNIILGVVLVFATLSVYLRPAQTLLPDGAAIHTIPYKNASFIFNATLKVEGKQCPQSMDFNGVNILPIPKYIWTFWDSSSVPDLPKKCMEGWKRLNPDHQVTVITPQNIHNCIRSPVPSNYYKLSSQAKSDWVRLAILAEKGGIWMDSTVILTASLDYIHNTQLKFKSEGFMYYLDGWTKLENSPILESWFIASVPRGYFITAWFHEFNSVIRDYGFDDQYLVDLKTKHGEEKYKNLLQSNSMPNYLKIHIAAQKIIQIDGILPPHAESAECGPFKLICSHNWDSKKAAYSLIRKWEGNLPIIFKLRGDERKALNEVLETQKAHPESIYARFLDPK